MFHHLLVATGSHPRSFRAVCAGLRLAWCTGIPVTILFVVDVSPSGGPASQGSSRDAIAAGERLFARARRIAASLRIGCTCRYGFGSDADSVIAEAMATQDCDLLVLPPPPITKPAAREAGCDV
ncbi:nucleotide-binding universal stress UspA family protein [Luteibacter jiangsuensis]|uniref:Nucleotide-binding universal stress UspA family protein n=1 Tax=Luteibacter jiangsuensis TaxID=637577 RepID=A0ABT9SYL3_9GAMM|nr:universal stress protein [Luteibacter jiangsuensis]MDQ0010084.1 nucleotide-binding universal stress UspA family protein [Luteibacter jiangsuensis]